MKAVNVNEAYENLANAIIIKALDDYHNPRYKNEVSSFFRSSWYSDLTDLESGAIMKLAASGVKPKRIGLYNAGGTI